jgi:hypothetical protein
MAANPVVPPAQLNLETQKTPTETIIRCSGKITAATTEQLQAAVRGLIPEKKRIVLDLRAPATWTAPDWVRWWACTSPAKKEGRRSSWSI